MQQFAVNWDALSRQRVPRLQQGAVRIPCEQLVDWNCQEVAVAARWHEQRCIYRQRKPLNRHKSACICATRRALVAAWSNEKRTNYSTRIASASRSDSIHAIFDWNEQSNQSGSHCRICNNAQSLIANQISSDNHSEKQRDSLWRTYLLVRKVVWRKTGERW